MRGTMKFILTKELGRFARWLRLLGFDASYFDSDDSKALFVRAFNERRIVLTKRIAIRGGKSVKVAYIKSDSLKDQFSELRRKLNINIGKKGLFTRCADCNKEVFEIHKDSVRSLVPEYVFKTQRKFFQCPRCGKIFWKATHWDRAKEFVSEVCR